MTVQYQKPEDIGSVAQAVEVWAESVEISPYATGLVPPYPKALVEDYSGYGASGASSFGTEGSNVSVNGAGSSSQVPESHDLEWVAGDTANFDLYFEGKCFTEVGPEDTQGLTWVQSTWESQVRNPHWYYYGYWWPPTWPGYRYLMSFIVTAEFLTAWNGLGPGTLVHLKGGTMWPGDFVWDLQTKQYTDPDPTIYETRTWMSGKVKVHPQVTQPQIYPPSNWPVLPYA